MRAGADESPLSEKAGLVALGNERRDKGRNFLRFPLQDHMWGIDRFKHDIWPNPENFLMASRR